MLSETNNPVFAVNGKYREESSEDSFYEFDAIREPKKLNFASTTIDTNSDLG
jgi:hypothetical protein